MSSEDATTLSAVPVLKGDNYHLWARKMMAYLQVKGLYKYMRDSFIAPLDLNVTELMQMNAHDWNATNDDGIPIAVPPAIQALVDQRQNYLDWLEDNEKARGNITLCLSDSITEIFENEVNARVLWIALRQRYGDTGRTSVYNEYQATMDWKLDASKDPETSLNSILAKFERLAGQGFMLPEEQKAMTILRGIPARWDSFAGTILATAPAAGLTVQHVCIQI